MKTKSNIWLTLLGLVIGAISYWRIPYNEMNLLEIKLWFIVGSGTLIGSFISTIYSNQKPSKIGLLITLGVILSTVIRIVYDSVFWDTTSHNLAPLEIIFTGFQSLPMAFSGAYLAKLIKPLIKSH